MLTFLSPRNLLSRKRWGKHKCGLLYSLDAWPSRVCRREDRIAAVDSTPTPFLYFNSQRGAYTLRVSAAE